MTTTKASGGGSRLIAATKAQALAAHRKKLASLERLIRRRLATVVESFYDIGVALTEILKKKLYAAGGHGSLEAYLAATKLIGVAQAMKLIAIVREIPREVALAAGPERSYALIGLAKATAEPDSAAELIERGTVAGQPAAKASVRAIAAAAKAERAKRPKTAATKEREKADAAVVKGLRALLRGVGLGAGVVAVEGGEVRVVWTRAQAERAIARGG
jgi:hypothetical protein